MTRRIVTRRPSIELSAETRKWVARLKAAHDDDGVTEAGFVRVGVEAAHHFLSLPDDERLEACLQVAQHASSAIAGRQVAVAFLVPEADR